MTIRSAISATLLASVFTATTTTATPLGALVCAAGAVATAPVHCFDFEGPPVGAALPTGATLFLPGAIMSVGPFQYGDGTWAPPGDVNIVGSNEAAGSPTQELLVDNVSIELDFNPPAIGVRFRYADLGGNVNFEVNGDFRNVGDLSALNGVVVGGSLVTVSYTTFGGNERGVVRVPGPVDHLLVGGQEFFIDDLCYRH